MNSDKDLNLLQAKLAQRVHDGDLVAKNHLLNSLLPLTEHIVLKHIAKGAKTKVELEEIVDQALVKSVSKFFSEERKYKLGTYFSWHLRSLLNS